MQLKATGDVDATQLDRHSLTYLKELWPSLLVFCGRRTHSVAMPNPTLPLSVWQCKYRCMVMHLL